MRLDLEPAISPMSPVETSASEYPLNDNVLAVKELLAEGVKAAQAGNRAKARTALLRAVDVEPRSESAWLWLASISEYPEELLVFLNNVLEINPENQRAIEWATATKSLLSKTFVQRGIDAIEENKSDYAAQCFNQALEYDQNNSMAWLWMASLADSSEGKIAYFERVLSIDPENETALNGFRAARYEISQRQLAEARSAAVSGRMSDANEFLDAIIGENPDSEDAWILRAHLAENFEAKISAYEKVLELNPENFAARSGIDSLRSIIETVMPAAAVMPVVSAETVESEPAANGAFAEFAVDKSPTQDLELPAAFSNQGSTVEDEPAAIDASASEPEAINASFDEENAASADDPIDDVQEWKDEQPQYAPEPDVLAADVSLELSEESGEEYAETTVSEIGSPGEFETQTAETLESEASEQTAVSDVSQPYTNGHELYHVPAENEIAASPDSVALDYQPELFRPEFGPAETFAEASPLTIEAPHSGVSVVSVAGSGNTFTNVSFCPFCNGENDAQSIVCQTCMAVLTLSDLETLITNTSADQLMMRDAVARMERERLSREFSEAEMTMLGIGHLNLRNLQYGLDYLQKASYLNPNNVVLGGQVNALHIRIEEIKQRDEIRDAMPRGKTILVVDDSPTVRKLIAGKLEKCGHEVFCSNDGVDAMELLEKLVPDLVLLDITMPRMDGYQVCKAIRSNPVTKDIPVVMISGKDGFFDKVRGRMAGTTGYVTKPFGPETLMKAVETYLGNPEASEIVN